MKVTIVLTLLLLLSYSCETRIGKTSQAEQLVVDSNQTVYKENYTDRNPYRDSIPPTNINDHQSLSFKFDLDSSGYILKTIHIYSGDTETQKIKTHKQINANEFQLIDWNFDGHKDITALASRGSSGCSYWIWNYSPTSGKYNYNRQLSEYLGLEIDTLNQYIVFHYRAGYPEEIWDSLKYVNNKLQFVKGLYRERYTDGLGNSWVKHTHKKMIQGVLITTVDSSITH
jgi:hypothetical protein